MGRIAGFLRFRRRTGWEVSMRTIAEWWTRGLASWVSNLAVAVHAHWKTACLVIAAIAIGTVSAEAQVSVEFAEGALAPAAEEMGAAGVDGSPDSMATMIEIAQRYGFGYGISPDEVRELVGSGYLAVRQIDCRMLDARYEAAMRLSRTLTGLAWLYAASAGMTVASPPVAAALGFGALVTGVAATAAGWIAADIRAQRSQVRCTKEGGIEWFRPAAREIRAAVDPVIFPYSWQRWCGLSASASCRG
jgi:hypothetical protein